MSNANQDETAAFLATLCREVQPSRDCLVQLSSVVEPLINNAGSQTAALYLRAVATHLPAGTAVNTTVEQTTLKHAVDKVVEATGVAAKLCQSRSMILQSGILKSLQEARSDHLSATHVEFLQCALLAGQYRFARRSVGATWPRPGKSSSVELILRYFYLRGIVHMGCDEWKQAIRAFWSVLSVPAEVVSMIAVEAWKKMVLANCILHGTSMSLPELVSPPSLVSNPVSRFFGSFSGGEGMKVDDDLGLGAYVDLAKACCAGDLQAFKKTTEKFGSTFETDKNGGLVGRLETALKHDHLDRMARLFVSAPIAAVVSDLCIPTDQLLPLVSQVDGLEASIEGSVVSFERSRGANLKPRNMSVLVQVAQLSRKLDCSLASSTRFQQITSEMSTLRRGVEDF